MSHIVTIKTEVRDANAVHAACQRLSLPSPLSGRHKLFSGKVDGLAVTLPDWVFPVVCDLSSGLVHFDNFAGRWGEQKHLDRFLQAYAVEKTKIEARRKGYSIAETPLKDGSIKLTLHTCGGVA